MLFVVYDTDSDLSYFLSSFSLPTNQSEIQIVKEKIAQRTRIRVAVDHHNQVIYAVKNKVPFVGTFQLVRFDYAGTNTQVLYEGSEFSIYTNLDVFDGTIVWTYFERYIKKTIYPCKPSPTCTEENMKTLYTTTDVST